MKIGTVNWDKCFLDMIKINCQRDFTEALIPYFDGLSKEKADLEDCNIDYKKAYKEVAHLENKSLLTQDEYFEWEGALGWYESIGEEIGFREESLASGLIISVWKLVNHLSLTVSHGLIIRDVSPKSDKYQIFRLGPKLGDVFWAECVNAASNYVRHSEDWNKKYYRYINGGSGDWNKDIPDKGNKTEKRNLLLLESMGINIDLIISSNDQSFKIAEKLNILDREKLNSLHSEWLSSVNDYAEKKLTK